MKINWGFGITLSIIVFTLISIGLIYFAFNQKINLVRDDYYEAELEFDEKIEIVNRTSNLQEQLDINLVLNKVKLNFPPLSEYSGIKGNIILYRPSDRNLDIIIPIELDSNYTQTLYTGKLVKGMWKIQVDWIADSLTYFNEKIVMIN